ncbi:hypothetical protein [Legionella waltersii]|uniref:Dot/Icm T4SS effector n=1 Tax=Legionella waltersii TaxID=66969 RepID=A0A0W1AM40_9GAMM|nr:hypothetical protein [Legionella waltersii]KTD82399.1 Dot/Icm T4SS effector [Legionella waltersii]SNV03526.1 Dot/Icm T4SS effector [Legionella waltersii]
MFEVDNSSDGNCLFYAYSISLMYYLRSKNDPKLAKGIFDKLNLSKEAQVELEKLLSKPSHMPYSKEDIVKTIEPILGRAVRDLAADQVLAEFEKAPKSTSLFSSAKYGLEYGFKHALESNDSNYSKLIDHEFDNPDYTQADLYHNDELKLEMEFFVSMRAPIVIEEMNRRWAEQERSLSELQLSAKEIKGFQAILLSQIIDEETIEYFRADNNANMNRFLKHIKKEFEWGSEETLMALHRAVQGERMVRNPSGTIDTFYDFPILLHVYTNGVSPFQQNGIPDLVLNNKHNVHWTSKIPDHIFVSKADDPEFQLLELLDAQIPAIRLGKLESNEQSLDRKLMQEWVETFKKYMQLLKSAPQTSIKEKVVQDAMLHISKGLMQFSSVPEFRASIKLVFSGFVTWLPKALEENKKTSGLSQLGFYSQPIVSSKDEVKSSKSSDISPGKEAKSSSDKSYPSELARFVKKAKQSGPRVTAALEQMYKLGTEGNDKYTPEKCRDIAKRYLNFVQSNHKNPMIDGVKTFIKKMDKIIQERKEERVSSLSLI